MSNLLPPGTVLFALVSLRPADQAQVLWCLLDRMTEEGKNPVLASRLTVAASDLDRGTETRLAPDLLEELAGEHWQQSLKDSFLQAVTRHNVVPPPAGQVPSLFRAEAAKHAQLKEFLEQLTAFERDLPRLIDRLASLYRLATASTEDLGARRRFVARLKDAHEEERRLQEMASDLRGSPVKFGTFDPDECDALLESTRQALEAMGSREWKKRTPPLLTYAARFQGNSFGDLISKKLHHPDFSGSEAERALQEILAYWDWERPEHWSW